MQPDGKQMVIPSGRCLRVLLSLALAVFLLPAPASDAARTGQKEIRPAAAKASTRSSKTITINNLRTSRNRDHIRVVLELARPVTITQQRASNPDRTIINLKNAVLSDTARQKVEDDGFPAEVAVTQAKPKLVQVTLDMEEVSGVMLRKLSKPHRFVLDYVTKGETPALKPKITLPPVTRQITSAERQARLDIETIVLDPGHGGRDPGAIGRDGLTEKEVVLDVALRLRDLLRDRLGKKVLMTRDKDEFIELDDRAKFANMHKADLFVSIHINSHPKRATRGIEMYHFGIASDRRAMEVAARENGDSIDHAQDFLDVIKADLALSKRIEDSQNLAWETKIAVVNVVTSQFDTEDHGVKTAPFYVLRYTAMPSILAELAFISNPSEERRLRQSAFRQKAAEGLFEGIRNYLNSAQVALAY